MPDYFRKYLQIAPLSHALWRASEAYELERINFRPSIIDLGCGFGEFAGVYFNSQIEMGVDISKKEVLQAIKTSKYKTTLEADARNLPFPENNFNTVISISTLEHIKDAGKVFSEVYRILKKGGLFIFTVPTSAVRNHMFFPKFFKNIGLERLADFYFYLFNRAFKHETMSPTGTWKKMAMDAGFEIQSIQGTISPKAVKAFELFLPLALPTQFFKALLGRRLPFSPQWRINLFHKLFKPLVVQGNKSESNILIVVRKPK